MSLETFIAAYIECALWSSTDNTDESGGEPLDKNYSPDDIAPEALAIIRKDCESFYTDPDNQAALEYWDDKQAGHDFWLTRNGHGAGFWDRYYGDTPEAKVGADLTHAAKVWGSVDLYIGDDGRIYHQ